MPGAIAVIIDSQSGRFDGKVEASLALPADTTQRNMDCNRVPAQLAREIISRLLAETATHSTYRIQWLT
jgi:hypothetical protein